MNFKDIDEVYVISLQHRIDRREQMQCELNEHGIKFSFFDAIQDENGAFGLIKTMRKLFTEILSKDQNTVMILEDDSHFLLPSVPFLNEVLPQLPQDYYCFHLGCNLIAAPRRISTNILKIDKAYATHAIIYSREAIELILPLLLRDEIVPYDILLMNSIQTYGKSYCTMPMLATQRESYSDIEKSVPVWGQLMATTFAMHTKPLQSMANEIAYCIGSHKINGFEVTVDPTAVENFNQNPDLKGKVCDCKKFIYDGEDLCGCAIKEMRAKWVENPNY